MAQLPKRFGQARRPRSPNASNQLIAYSATQSGDESVTIPGLPAGTYTAYVNGYKAALGSSATSADFTFTRWLVDDTDVGNLTVTPPAPEVAIATPQDLTVNWTGLDPAKQYLGWVKYLDKDGNDAGLTVVAGG